MPTKILAIDDSKTMRLAIKITFAAEDADVTSVSKGSEALARAKQMGADAVLVDAKLADGEPSGYEVCHALKQDPQTAHIPVLLMVSNQSGVDQGKLTSVGGDGFVTKPFDTQDLIEKVRQAVASAKPAGAVSRPASPAPTIVPTAAVPPPGASVGFGAPPARPATPDVGRPIGPPPSSVAPPAAVSPPAATPANRAPVTAEPAPRPTTTRTVVAAPAPSPAASFGAAAPPVGGEIPIAVPIPFTAADSPTAGMLKRLQDAGGGASGIDPKVVEALVQLSREVVEQVVWEVVPDLAEELIKRRVAEVRSA